MMNNLPSIFCELTICKIPNMQNIFYFVIYMYVAMQIIQTYLYE